MALISDKGPVGLIESQLGLSSAPSKFWSRPNDGPAQQLVGIFFSIILLNTVFMSCSPGLEWQACGVSAAVMGLALSGASKSFLEPQKL